MTTVYAHTRVPLTTLLSTCCTPVPLLSLGLFPLLEYLSTACGRELRSIYATEKPQTEIPGPERQHETVHETVLFFVHPQEADAVDAGCQ